MHREAYDIFSKIKKELWMKIVEADKGNTADVLKFVKEMVNQYEMVKAGKKMTNSDLTSPFRIALIYSALKQVDKCFEWLEEAYRIRDPVLAWNFTEFLLNKYLSYKRFI